MRRIRVLIGYILRLFIRILRAVGIIDKSQRKLLLGKVRYFVLGISTAEREFYIDYVLNNRLDDSQFTPISDSDYVRKPDDVKLIATYLPQFHALPMNDEWYGKGFTEWTNAARAAPQYVGHYQPHIPMDVGFYSLETTGVMKRQIELAKKYGIYGFCFYYYWFSGEKIMEKPIYNFLQDKSLDMPFCLFWANENWSKQWDGGDREVLYRQKLEEGDDEKFMNDILPFMKDDRYIKINNQPVLIIYRSHMFTKERGEKFILKTREIAKKNGFDDLYLIDVRYKNAETGHLSFDASMEFYPESFKSKQINEIDNRIVNNKFSGKCMNIAEWVDKKYHIYDADGPLFKGCFTNWDNTARKCYTGALVYQTSPEIYKTWLRDIVGWTEEKHENDKRFVLINAWNEWAEGAHLEPDLKYGYAYLQATRDVLEGK
ncbi:hypothetical protein FACS1894205_1840 [Alphaproteobacteria bacterium]|nr:hypothetical protein FACS1894205_1840 [Alphaproteobacteria bacterium]